MATSLFAAPVYVPKFRAFSAAGVPLAAGKLESYVAGTSTPLATYPTYADALAGTNANANPVILDANGEANVFGQNVPYKFILKDSAGTIQWTEDNVYVGCGTATPAVTEWVPETNAFAFASATSFTVAGVDVTATYHAGRRVRIVDSGGAGYATVTSSSFAVNTTVNVINDSGVIDAGLSSVAYGMTSYTNPSYLDPRTVFSVAKNGTQTGFAGNTKVTGWTVGVDTLSEWVAGSNHWLCKYPGNYLIQAQVGFSNTAASIQTLAQICTTAGAVLTRAEQRSSPTGSQVYTVSLHYVATLAAGSTISLFVLGDANTSVFGVTGDTRLSVTRIA